MEERSGIIGLTSHFKEAVADLPDGAKLVFMGSVAVCTPFAELLAYAVKDRHFDLMYMPRAEPRQTRHMKWLEYVGYTVSEDGADPHEADVLVVLGGLAMPKFGPPLELVGSVIRDVSKDKGTKVVGVGFMDILRRSGWTEELPFDIVIDATLTVHKI